jgi:GNAT superfamily N-acetyltransferase
LSRKEAQQVTATVQSATDIQLRPAVSEDEEFLLQLYLATQSKEITLWSMNAPEWEQLQRMQFRGRKQSYAAQYPDAQDLIICFNDGTEEEIRVGRHLVTQQEDSILGIDLAILPQYQNQGIGGRVLQDVQQQCSEEGLCFRLQVLHANPARRLYDRLGFNLVSQDLLYAQMEWNSASI